MPNIESFTEFDLGDEIQAAILEMGITKPTPIQALSIEPGLEGKDIIAKAETGTGKTLAFGAPMMARIDPERASVLGLVLCPTRELAQQVADVLALLGKPRGIEVALVVGGDPLMPQVKALKAGAQMVVGTPGRVIDLYQQRFLSFPWAEFCVLDEADKMFEIGFADDVRKILSYMPDERQTMLFSATFPREVLRLARESTKDPVEISTAKGTATVSSIDQMFIKLDDDDKAMALVRLMEQSKETDVFLIFCERRTDVDRLMRRLERTRFSIKALHGGYDQAARFRVMSAFRTGEVKALVATDVASRGLDVEHVSHVINVAVPRELEEYTHRIGRTGRAGRTGTAITFVSRRDFAKWTAMFKRTEWDVREIEAPGRQGQSRREERPARERRPARRPERQREEAPAPAGTSDGLRRVDRSNEERERTRRPRREAEEREPEQAPKQQESRNRAGAEDTREERPRRRRRSAEEREQPQATEQQESRGRTGSEDTREERPRRRRRSAEERERSAPREQPSESNREDKSGTREERPRRPRRDSQEPSRASSEEPRTRRRREEPSEAPREKDQSREGRPRQRRSQSEEPRSDDRPRREARTRDETKEPTPKETTSARPRREQRSRSNAPSEPPAFGAGTD